jgi:metallo-beta-lactamase family protein
MIDFLAGENGRDPCRIVFSGDIGQWDTPLMRDPSVFDRADVVIMESTYGDRDHDDPGPVDELLAEAVRTTSARGANLVVPVFAIERAQQVLYYLARLRSELRIPEVPVFLDSPMAVEVTRIFDRYPSYLDEETNRLIRSGKNPLEFPGLRLVPTVEESKALNRLTVPAVILAGSGMATGGRIKHHLTYNIERAESTILFVGYQARGTLGRIILDGAPEVRIFGRMFKVRARVIQINGLSGHAGRRDLRRWLGFFRERPQKLFLCHGEEGAALAFAAELEREGWAAVVPRYGEAYEF